MDLKDKREKLIEENLKREHLVDNLNEQITNIQTQIVLEKEAHDYTRGQIELLDKLLKESTEDK
jgi:hypothetical protein